MSLNQITMVVKLHDNCLTVKDFILLRESVGGGTLPKLQIGQALNKSINSVVARHNYKISLICSEQSLVERLSKDVENGIRTREVIARSVSRLKNYTLMDTIKIDVSKINVVQASQEIISYIGGVYET